MLRYTGIGTRELPEHLAVDGMKKRCPAVHGPASRRGLEKIVCKQKSTPPSHEKTRGKMLLMMTGRNALVAWRFEFCLALSCSFCIPMFVPPVVSAVSPLLRLGGALQRYLRGIPALRAQGMCVYAVVFHLIRVTRK